MALCSEAKRKHAFQLSSLSPSLFLSCLIFLPLSLSLHLSPTPPLFPPYLSLTHTRTHTHTDHHHCFPELTRPYVAGLLRQEPGGHAFLFPSGEEEEKEKREEGERARDRGMEREKRVREEKRERSDGGERKGGREQE